MTEPFNDDLKIVLETLTKHKDGVLGPELFLENDIEYDSVQEMNFLYAKDMHNRAVRNNAHASECAPNCPLGEYEEIISVNTVTGLKLFLLDEKSKKENKRKKEVEMEIIEIEGEESFSDRIRPEDLLHKPFTGEIIASGSYKSKFTRAYEPWYLIRATSDDKEVSGTFFATPAMSRKLQKEGDITTFHSRGLVKKVYAGKEYITFI
jgi:hypothetical protein